MARESPQIKSWGRWPTSTLSLLCRPTRQCVGLQHRQAHEPCSPHSGVSGIRINHVWYRIEFAWSATLPEWYKNRRWFALTLGLLPTHPRTSVQE